MVSIHLNDEEKLFVLFAALALFLTATFVSVCLALPFCALNKWLSERYERRKRRRQERHFLTACSHGFVAYQRQHGASTTPATFIPQLGNQNKCAPVAAEANSLEPPPAYETALRAHQLQSGLGASDMRYTRSCQTNQTNQDDDDEDRQTKQLNLGDYFHAPREIVVAQHQQVVGDSNHNEAMAMGDKRQQASGSVRLRLWVKLVEPDELVERARAQLQHTRQASELAADSASACASTGGTNLLGSRLSRQLSIPQFLGSLRNTLAAVSEQQQERELLTSSNSDEQQTNSLGSSTASAPSDDSIGRANERAPEMKQEKPGASDAQVPMGRLLALTSREAGSDCITSRVLHMNVASFSYTKDESLISCKRHQQLNWRHFGATGSGADPGAGSKSCQLLIGVCDLENLLASCWRDERACARLAFATRVLVQCEILAPAGGRAATAKLAARNLLMGNPLRRNGEQASEASAAHAKVDFAAARAGSSQSPDNTGREQVATATEWQHVPDATGKPIVTFQSVAKLVAAQQRTESLVASGSGPSSLATNAPVTSSAVDLIQFDSVFVSPILSKATIEAGAHLRLRVYAQCKHLNDTCLAELKLPLKRLLAASGRDNLGDATSPSAAGQYCHGGATSSSDFILDNLLANLVNASTGTPLPTLLERIEQEQNALAERSRTLESQGSSAAEECASTSGRPFASIAFNKWWHSSASDSNLGKVLELESNPKGEQVEEEEEQEKYNLVDEQQQIEQNYMRSMIVSHWLNYLVAPSYECQLVEEQRGELVLGVTYLPTSNRLIFNALRASIDLEHLDSGGGGGGGGGLSPLNFIKELRTASDSSCSVASSKQLIKKLRLRADTCYLLRFLMVANGRVIKRKQTRSARKPEWDSLNGGSCGDQEAPITFDLVNVSVEQPSFIVVLVLRSHASEPFGASSSSQGAWARNKRRPQHAVPAPGSAQSEPDLGASGAVWRQATDVWGAQAKRAPSRRRDLVIGHLVLGERMWRELRSQPRKQIVKQFRLL